MVKPIKIRRAGGSLAATLPKELAERFNLAAGDLLFAAATEEGILLTPYAKDFARAMQVYERGARKYRNALRELAK